MLDEDKEFLKSLKNLISNLPDVPQEEKKETNLFLEGLNAGIPEKLLKNALHIPKRIDISIENNILIFGTSGVGKTTQAILLLLEHIKQGRKVLFIDDSYLAKIERQQISEFLVDLNQYQVILLDDLGILQENIEIYKKIILARMQKEKYFTIITTNESIPAMLGIRFADKMQEFFKIVKMTGKSFRTQMREIIEIKEE